MPCHDHASTYTKQHIRVIYTTMIAVNDQFSKVSGAKPLLKISQGDS